eukprot:COSAG02_NODE_2652_length_8323_cov_32.383268_3_plen_123_part_00
MPVSPLNVDVSDGHVVDLSRWLTDGIASRSTGGGEGCFCQQGAGLTPKALTYLHELDASFPSPLDISTVLHTIIPKHDGDASKKVSEAPSESEFENPLATGPTFDTESESPHAIGPTFDSEA